MMNEFLMSKDQRFALISASELNTHAKPETPEILLVASIFRFAISIFSFSYFLLSIFRRDQVPDRKAAGIGQLIFLLVISKLSVHKDSR